jgi:hypothetical protein
VEVEYLSDKEARKIARKLAKSVTDKVTIEIDSTSIVAAEVDRMDDDSIWVAAWIRVPNK